MCSSQSWEHTEVFITLPKIFQGDDARPTNTKQDSKQLDNCKRLFREKETEEECEKTCSQHPPNLTTRR